MTLSPYDRAFPSAGAGRTAGMERGAPYVRRTAGGRETAGGTRGAHACPHTHRTVDFRSPTEVPAAGAEVRRGKGGDRGMTPEAPETRSSFPRLHACPFQNPPSH